jgi:hypothetical protein
MERLRLSKAAALLKCQRHSGKEIPLIDIADYRITVPAAPPNMQKDPIGSGGTKEMPAGVRHLFPKTSEIPGEGMLGLI